MVLVSDVEDYSVTSLSRMSDCRWCLATPSEVSKSPEWLFSLFYMYLH